MLTAADVMTSVVTSRNAFRDGEDQAPSRPAPPSEVARQHAILCARRYLPVCGCPLRPNYGSRAGADRHLGATEGVTLPRRIPRQRGRTDARLPSSREVPPEAGSTSMVRSYVQG